MRALTKNEVTMISGSGICNGVIDWKAVELYQADAKNDGKLGGILTGGLAGAVTYSAIGGASAIAATPLMGVLAVVGMTISGAALGYHYFYSTSDAWGFQ
jgi:hypothetical protein